MKVMFDDSALGKCDRDAQLCEGVGKFVRREANVSLFGSYVSRHGSRAQSDREQFTKR